MSPIPSIDRVLGQFLEEQRQRLAPPAPEEATKLLRDGWDVSCALARVHGTWRMIDVANVYPL